MALLHNLQTIATFLIILSILVVVHEWGHFIVARLFGIRVDDFSIGFGKRLIRLGKRGDTEYNIRMLPLGGFVRIAGMEVDEAPLIQAKERITRIGSKDDPDSGMLPLVAENMGEPEPYNAPDGFNAKPLWQRSLVILAGPVMSFVLGYFLFCMMGWTIGTPTDKILNRIGEVEPGGIGQKIGLQAGDVIEAINGKPITNGDQMVSIIHDSLGRKLTLTIGRGSETLTKVGTPMPMTDTDGKIIEAVSVSNPGAYGPAIGLKAGDTIEQIGDISVSGTSQALAILRNDAGKNMTVIVTRAGAITPLHGILPSGPLASMPTLYAHELGMLKFQPITAIKRTGFIESIKQGNQIMVNLFESIASLIRQGQLHKNVGGIIYMYRATGIAVQNGLSVVVSLMAQLSISLAIFNLLPIPILDGGHLLAFFIEWVRGGKKMTEEWQQRFMLTGLTIIGILFILIMAKNIRQVIFHQLPQ